MDNLVEVTAYYETWDGKVVDHKFKWDRFDVGEEIDYIIAKGFRKTDLGGFVHHVPPGMIREIIWDGCK